MQIHRIRVVALAVAACLLPATADPASLEYVPNLLEMTPGQAATMEVRNHAGRTVIQVRAFVWQQRGDIDELLPTDNLVVSPPIFSVPEHESQIVRLLNRSADSGAAERSYRLLLDEVPPPDVDRQQIKFALRVSLPVFIEPTGTTTGEVLEWRAERSDRGVVLVVQNTGVRHARVAELVVTLPSGATVAATAAGKNPYVLPGMQRHFVLPEASAVPAGSVLRLRVTTGAGTKQATVTAP